MRAYHIHTEAKRNLGRLASASFPQGFTITTGRGYWRGKGERAAVIEVVTDKPSKINALARKIKRVNKQMAVLVESMPVRERMV